MAKDKFHLAVREALEKEGWKIVSDPFSARYADKRIEIDLEAEKLILAEREKRRIFVEVKSFLSNSAFYEFHSALGQYLNYRRILRLLGEKGELFLAMPQDAFDLLMRDDFGQLTIEEENLKLLLYQPENKVISQWII